MNTQNRPYRKIWEKENPWLTRRMDGDKGMINKLLSFIFSFYYILKFKMVSSPNTFDLK